MKHILLNSPALMDELTPRESSVLIAAQKNYPVSEIATMLQIPDALVIRHLNNIIAKLNYSNNLLAYQIILSYELEDQE